MKVTYDNRYGDTITFEQINKTEIRMSGYGSYYRVSYGNDYTYAYIEYVQDCNALEEPDNMLLHDDGTKLRMLTLEEFTDQFIETNGFYDKKSAFYKYASLIESDMSSVTMIDPSGGPYIAVGGNVGRYFDDGVQRIISSIKIDSSQATLQIEA